MSLALYKKKRNFKDTPEPAAKASKKDEHIFVIQRHKATRLHYDFRLEMNGTLKSWAVPKGPSLNPADKRLAMMVEDHPVSYATFKGIIPEGNYGAGIVEIWDHGTYELMDETPNGSKAIKNGSIKFVLKGKKLKGEFALVKLKNNAAENAWLLLKHKDKYAVTAEYNSEDDTAKNSPINKALAEKKTAAKKVATKSATTRITKKAAVKKKPGRKLKTQL